MHTCVCTYTHTHTHTHTYIHIHVRACVRACVRVRFDRTMSAVLFFAEYGTIPPLSEYMKFVRARGAVDAASLMRVSATDPHVVEAHDPTERDYELYATLDRVQCDAIVYEVVARMVRKNGLAPIEDRVQPGDLLDAFWGADFVRAVAELACDRSGWPASPYTVWVRSFVLSNKLTHASYASVINGECIAELTTAGLVYLFAYDPDVPLAFAMAMQQMSFPRNE
jgi:hypothetical protein